MSITLDGKGSLTAKSFPNVMMDLDEVPLIPIPYHPFLVYLPTFTIKINQM